MKHKIKMLKQVCGAGIEWNVGDILVIETDSTLTGPNFNGATVKIIGYPYRKFFWHDEFKVVDLS